MLWPPAQPQGDGRRGTDRTGAAHAGSGTDVSEQIRRRGSRRQRQPRADARAGRTRHRRTARTFPRGVRDARCRGMQHRGNRQRARHPRRDRQDTPASRAPPAAQRLAREARVRAQRRVPVSRPALRADDASGARASAQHRYTGLIVTTTTGRSAMLNYAIIVFAIAAVGGLILAAHVLRGKFAPWALSLGHAVLGAAGLVLLILIALQGAGTSRLLAALGILVVAAL